MCLHCAFSIGMSSSIVEQLPTRLRNFFARYPPQIYSALVAPRPTAPGTEGKEGQEQAHTQPEGKQEPLPSPYTPDRQAKGYTPPDPAAFSPSKAFLYSHPEFPNPFLPRKNFRNGKWFGPRYGLRQQADLVKLAIKYNVEPLLPPGRKSTEYKEIRQSERGLQIKGTGIGQKVKGHKWERTMEARLEERKKAMLEMPEMIRLWKQVSNHSFSLSPFPFFCNIYYICEDLDRQLTMRITERTRSWMEAVAQEVNLLCTICISLRLFG